RWHASLFGGFYPDPFARSVVDDYAGTGAAGAVGSALSYAYPRAWGSLSAVATFFAGPDDGGAINTLSRRETARLFLTSTGRLRAEVRPVGRVSVWGEARLRRRALVEPDADPAFVGALPRLAWDVTIGVRSSGDLARLRLAAAFTEITDFRAETQLITASAG